MLSDFTAVANAISATTKKTEKERLLADYLRGLDDASLERAVVFLSGSPFPLRDERVTGIGGAAIGDAVSDVTGRSSDEIWAGWTGDAGDTVAVSFTDDPSLTITLSELGEYFERIAATSGAIGKKNVLVELLRKVNAQGARFIVKILTGELRIGLQEGLVESAIAKAFGRTVDAVRRANMFTGDIGAAALLARSDALDSAKMTLFHPFAFMLAQPEEDPDEILAALGEGAFADDKYDGIRAQVHSDGTQVRIYSRTLDNVTHRFPEIESAALAIGHSFIFDGEIVAFSDRILPFAVIQTRLGRRKVSETLLRDAPVAFFAFDLLYEDGHPLFELPLHERLARLRTIMHGGAIRHSDQSPIRDAKHIDELFDAARARANEGLVIKDPNSIYTPGRRGKSWLKYKKALATLDCVVTAAEYGHGKRRSVLSDYTFAVLRDKELVNIGKAYSGLTDVEIDKLTKHFKEITKARHGPVHIVEPTVVLEIAFDRIQESARHKSGYALRFPRIVRIRDDKTVDHISTIDEVRRIYEGQLKREEGLTVKD
jgi:ATP-dependent DNA ligase